ncbi:MAG: sulfotransferase domain-containing protein, partial [Jaaginema sp. PMC 1079.18]|nr:sulfotransferase domain-containing protein [Jaaginema sp. PMC 1079.18]
MNKLKKFIANWLVPPAVTQGIHEVLHREALALERAALEQAALERAALEQAVLERAALEQAALERAKNLPPIFINTLPKSGSVFISRSLSQGLGIRNLPLSYGYFPYDLIDINKIADLAKNGGTSQAHIDTSLMNLELLKYYCPKFIVHIRDPRQSMISWVHHINRLNQELKYPNDRLILQYSCPIVPDDFYEKPLSYQYDWHIENYFPLQVEWLNQWISVRDKNSSLNIFLSQYEDFCIDNETHILKILDFYGIPHEAYSQPKLEKNMSNHFRQGKVDEWRYV